MLAYPEQENNRLYRVVVLNSFGYSTTRGQDAITHRSWRKPHACALAKHNGRGFLTFHFLLKAGYMPCAHGQVTLNEVCKTQEHLRDFNPEFWLVGTVEVS